MTFLQNIDTRKLLIIIGFVALVIILGYLLYWLFFQPTVLPEEEEVIPAEQLPGAVEGAPSGITEEEAAIGIPEAQRPAAVTKVPASKVGLPDEVAGGGITQITDLDYEITSSLTLDSSGTTPISYNPSSGKFYQITSTGEKIALSDKVYKNVENLSWSPSKESAILEFPDGSNIYYDFEKDKQITLPKDWEDFNFNPSGSKIAFKDMNNLEEYRFLGIANPDGSGIKYLEAIGGQENDFILDWSPNGKQIAMFNNGNNAQTTKLYFIGENDENFKSIVVNGYGVETKWVPDGQRLIYSAHNTESDHKPVLYVVDATGSDAGANHRSLDLNTWPDKCTFQDQNIMYCAVPKELPKGADYVPEIADTIADYIYKIDMRTGVKTFMAEPEYEYTIDNMVVSEDGTMLYFTDKATQSLHSIRLR